MSAREGSAPLALTPDWLRASGGGLPQARWRTVVCVRTASVYPREFDAPADADVESDVESVATVVNVGRRLAVIDCEIGLADSRPCALARVIAARTTHL